MLSVILAPRRAEAAPLSRIRNQLLAEESKRAATRREVWQRAWDPVTINA